MRILAPKKEKRDIYRAIGTRMIAYHLNYDHYGDEINHLDEISCKCRICMSNNRETE